MKDFEIKDNELLRQFETEIDGECIKLEYTDQRRKIFLTQFKIPPHLKGKGVEEKFFEAVIDEISDNRKTRIMPTGEEIRAFFKENKMKYKSLLPIGISL